jgi:hypothetical protein
MSVGKRFSRRSLAPLTALAMFFALVVPLAGVASAGHKTDHDLNCTPETATNNTGVGSVHTVTCTVSNADDSTAAAEPDGLGAFTNEVDAEIQGVNTSSTGLAGSNANSGSDTAYTPLSPDFTGTCTDAANSGNGAPVAADDGVCVVTFQWTGLNPGTDTFFAWIDDNQNNNTVDGDLHPTDPNDGPSNPEGPNPNAGPTDDGGPAAGSDPGAGSEVDDTDVVAKTWVAQLPALATLDCDDDGAPGDEADAPASDRATNPAAEGELYTCLLWNDNGQGTGGQADNGIQDGTEPGISGVKIDGENLNGANDPDTSGQGQSAGSVAPATGPNNGTPDYNDACTTAADGRCTHTVNPTEAEVGVALICYWSDEDSDAVYNDTGLQQDGGSCDTETNAGPNGDEGNDGATGAGVAAQRLSDIVQKIWQTAGTGAIFDLEPENDANATTAAAGTVHILTGTARDAFGGVAPNTPIDFYIIGGSRNAAQGQICDNSLTNANGVATCQYGDAGTTAIPIAPGTFQTDNIEACISTGAAGINCAAPNGSPDANGDPELDDNTDRVAKFWFTTVPTPGSITIDMEGPAHFPAPGAGCNAPDQTTAVANAVNTGHTMCVTVLDTNNQPLPGRQVTLTITGVGEWFNDADGNGTFNTAGGDTLLGKTITRHTDNNGDVFADLTSTQGGTSNITATTDSLTVSGAKPWNPANPRIITLTPPDGTNETGQAHQLQGRVVDVNDNGVAGVAVDVILDGNASVTNSPNTVNVAYYGNVRQVHRYNTDANGNFTVTINSQVAGSQSIEAAIGGDVADGLNGRNGAPQDTDDDCDLRANEAGPAPGGGVGSAPGAKAGVCFVKVSKTYVVPVKAQCEDGIDNDTDGKTDFSASPSAGDPGCSSASDNDESDDPPVCSDAKDNDNDGKIDTEDPGCENDPLGTAEEPDPVPPPKIEPTQVSAPTHGSPFTGTVDSDKAKCEKKRKVTIKKVRKGKDRKIGSDRTNRFGIYRVGHNRPHGDGRFYAKAKKKEFVNKAGRTVICKAGRSPSVKI